MATIAEKIAAAKRRGRESVRRKVRTSKDFYDQFFNGQWNVFVVKRDEATGGFVGKTVACAECPA